MNAANSAGTERSPCRGTVQILLYNWPQYVIGALVCIGAALFGMLGPLPGAVRLLVLAGAGGTAFWLLTSIGASYWVYDRSPLCRWRWIPKALPAPPRRWASIHVGLDEAGPVLLELFPESEGTILDVFDASEMTEPSIHRARRLTPPVITPIAADFRALPLEDASLDTVFLIFAAHEIRSPELRLRFFGELRRVLEPGGVVLLVEHLRDAANFAVFGPWFMHFHSRREWLRVARESGFSVARETRFTPFVGVFLLQRER
jgi:SAM-dependent methyltransferase